MYFERFAENNLAENELDGGIGRGLWLETRAGLSLSNVRGFFFSASAYGGQNLSGQISNYLLHFRALGCN